MSKVVFATRYLVGSFIMFSQRRWIILLLFPILGSCKKPSTTSLNRKIGCTDKTLCWDDHHHLCIPCDIKNNHQDNHHDDHHDDKVDDLHYDDKLEPPFGLGKKQNDYNEHQNIDCFQNMKMKMKSMKTIQPKIKTPPRFKIQDALRYTCVGMVIIISASRV